MIVYRVENADGDGPYTLLDRDVATRPAPTPAEEAENARLDAELPSNFDFEHPTVFADFGPRLARQGFIFACPTEEILSQWFWGMGNYLRRQSLRISTYRVEDAWVGRSGLQVRCELSNCTLLSVKPIWWR
jgi:hypothetical protein